MKLIRFKTYPEKHLSGLKGSGHGKFSKSIKHYEVKKMNTKNISQKFRKNYGLTQQDLANLCGKARSTVMNWEYNRGLSASTAYVLQTILDQKLDAKQMVIKLKQIFDKPEDTKSI